MTQDEKTTVITPEGAAKWRPVTEDPEADAEAHGMRVRPFTEDAEVGPEGASKWRPVTEDPDGDAEGHVIK